MIAFPLPSSFFSGLSYFLTFVATLRAGSRANYLFRNDGVLGQVDGPLLLPESNLFEAAYGFESAVFFSLQELINEVNDATMNVSNLDVILSLQPTQKKKEKSGLMNYFHKIVNKTKSILKNLNNDENDELSYYSISPYASYKKIDISKDVNHSMNDSSILEDDDIIFSIENTSHLSMNESQIKEDKQSSSIQLSILQNMNKKWKRTLSPSSWILSSRKKNKWGGIYRPWRRKKHNRVNSKKRYDYSPEPLTNLDFSSSMSKTIHIPSKSIQKEESIKRNAYVTTYAPKTFAALREKFGIKENEFLNSLTGPYISFQSNSKGAARAGGFFFFSRDGAYLVKTLKKPEAETLLEMLPNYYKYMKKNARNSLLTRYCGMYQVRVGNENESNKTSFTATKDDDEYIFIVMNSVFPAEGSKFISERYDLKGSTVGRECSLEEREKKGADAVLKDLDLAREVEHFKSINIHSSNYGIHTGAGNKALLLAQLRKDVGLLTACGVMDYSLLVGVVNMEKDSKSQPPLQKVTTKRMQRLSSLLYKSTLPLRLLSAPPRYILNHLLLLGDKTVSTMLTLPLPYYGAGFSVVDGGSLSVLHGKRLGNRAIYYLGVIDFLQPWTTRKLLERELKSLMGYDTSAISCVDPKFYASRFLTFIDAHVS